MANLATFSWTVEMMDRCLGATAERLPWKHSVILHDREAGLDVCHEIASNDGDGVVGEGVGYIVGLFVGYLVWPGHRPHVLRQAVLMYAQSSAHFDAAANKGHCTSVSKHVVGIAVGGLVSIKVGGLRIAVGGLVSITVGGLVVSTHEVMHRCKVPGLA